MLFICKVRQLTQMLLWISYVWLQKSVPTTLNCIQQLLVKGNEDKKEENEQRAVGKLKNKSFKKPLFPTSPSFYRSSSYSLSMNSHLTKKKKKEKSEVNLKLSYELGYSQICTIWQARHVFWFCFLPPWPQEVKWKRDISNFTIYLWGIFFPQMDTKLYKEKRKLERFFWVLVAWETTFLLHIFRTSVLLCSCLLDRKP